MGKTKKSGAKARPSISSTSSTVFQCMSEDNFDQTQRRQIYLEHANVIPGGVNVWLQSGRMAAFNSSKYEEQAPPRPAEMSEKTQGILRKISSLKDDVDDLNQSHASWSKIQEERLKTVVSKYEKREKVAAGTVKRSTDREKAQHASLEEKTDQVLRLVEQVDHLKKLHVQALDQAEENRIKMVEAKVALAKQERRETKNKGKVELLFLGEALKALCLSAFAEVHPTLVDLIPKDEQMFVNALDNAFDRPEYAREENKLDLHSARLRFSELRMDLSPFELGDWRRVAARIRNLRNDNAHPTVDLQDARFSKNIADALTTVCTVDEKDIISRVLRFADLSETL